MDDVTFLRNFSRRGRVVLLADGTALPVPVSVMDDPALAGATFRINLISPEGDESGDRRTFVRGTIEHRDLPLPLLWQWQLADGHKNAVVVGRIDHVERVPEGLGNARGVFDSGPWGREAERMVRSGMLRFVSGDYSSFSAKILDKVEPDEGRIQDDKISVDRSKLVAATIVAKPAFEGCYIEILEDDQLLPNGIIEGGPIVVTAAALRLVRPDMVARLERLEQIEAEQLSLIASATAERVNEHRLRREREIAVARVRAAQNVTAAFKPMPSNWLSAKAKLQPRDRLGRWIEIGSTVRWRQGSEKIGGVKRGGDKSGFGQGAPYKQGRVKSFNAQTGEYEIEPLDGSQKVSLAGDNVEVVKAVIPASPDEAQKIDADLGALPKKPSEGTWKFPPKETDAPSVPEEQALETADELKVEVTDAIKTAKSPDGRTKEVGLDRLSDLLGVEIDRATPVPADAIGEPKHEDKLIEDREALGRQLFNNLGRKNETWEKDGEKYMRAGDKLRKVTKSNLVVGEKRRGWIENTYGKDAAEIKDPETRKNEKWAETWENRPKAPSAAPAPAPAPAAPKPAAPKPAAPAIDPIKKLGGDIVDAQQKKNAKSSKQQILDGDTPMPLIKGGNADAPTGNWTEMAKTLFQNLHPDSSWDDADQTEWIEAAKKAMETRNAA